MLHIWKSKFFSPLAASHDLPLPEGAGESHCRNRNCRPPSHFREHAFHGAHGPNFPSTVEKDLIEIRDNKNAREFSQKHHDKIFLKSFNSNHNFLWLYVLKNYRHSIEKVLAIK